MKLFPIIAILLAAVLGCTGGGDEANVPPVNPPDDTTHVTPPSPGGKDSLSVDERPSWKVTSAIDPTQSSMTLTILLSGITVTGDFNTTWTFQPDESDLVAAFIGGDCRGVTSPKVYDSVLAFLPVGATETDNLDTKTPVVVKYYSSRLHHIFTVQNEIIFTKGTALGSPANPLVFVWKK